MHTHETRISSLESQIEALNRKVAALVAARAEGATASQEPTTDGRYRDSEWKAFQVQFPLLGAQIRQTLNAFRKHAIAIGGVPSDVQLNDFFKKWPAGNLVNAKELSEMRKIPKEEAAAWLYFFSKKGRCRYVTEKMHYLMLPCEEWYSCL